MEKITITGTEGNWTFGRLGEYRFEVKHFAEPSEYGLEFDGGPGRISKLWVTRGYSTVCAYDRGWDKLPAYEEAQDACAEIIRRFN
ncbi:MAG: hypothetical protein IKD70_06490 [Eggerthellaceae bacterium]|nr:hypothetical protein [Eggerthellaceae bacterium]